MLPVYFASEASSGGILGFSVRTYVVQLITFLLVFLIIKRFAFKPIVLMLEKRRQVIEDGVLLGEKMEKRQSELEGELDKVVREARHEADRIIANAHKESREVVTSAEKSAKVKVEAIMKDADARIVEDTDRARRHLEKDLVGLVSEATDAVVGEKLNNKKDVEIVEKALKGRK
jgi:F-type H+-transporting ATPase subunit b